MRRALWILFLVGGAECLAADQTVTIGPGLSFTPSTVTVTPGEKVTWVWAAAGHSSTSDATSGPEVWDSGILAPPQMFSHTFLTLGTYGYYCTVHGAPGGIGMSGLVQVVPGATPTPTASPSPTVSPSTTTPTPTGPAATATPTVTGVPGGPPGAIPALGLAGRLALLIGLVAAGVLSISFALKN